MTRTVAVMIASLRKDSLNEKLVRALEKLAGDRLKFTQVDIGALPHYNEDLWANVPPSVTHMKEQVEAADALLIATPEFNRSYPGFLKNAFDWGSRPWGKSSWQGKPAAIIGTSPGAVGTAVAQAELRTQLVALGTLLMPAPEAYIQFKPGLIDDEGNVASEDTRQFLAAYVDAVIAFINRVS